MKNWSEFSIPKNGDAIFIRKKQNKLYNYIFTVTFSLFFTGLILFIIQWIFNANLKDVYLIFFPFILFSIFFVFFNGWNNENEIKKVNFYESYLSVEFGVINLKIEYSEISSFSFENTGNYIVKIYFNNNSGLYKRFKHYGSNELTFTNNDIIELKKNIELINYLNTRI